MLLWALKASADEWYAEAMSRYSASSDWYRFVQASYELKEVYGHRTSRLRSIDGDIRTVNAEPQSYYETLDVPWGGTLRETGDGSTTMHQIFSMST